MRARGQERVDEAGGRTVGRRTVTPPPGSGRAAGGHLVALQRAAGNRAVTRAVEAQRHEHGPGCGHTEAAVQRAAVHRTQVAGQAGPPAVQRKKDGPSGPERRTVHVGIGTRGTKVKVRCERKNPQQPWVVFLPSGTDPDQREEIAQQLHRSQGDIKFTNARNDEVELVESSGHGRRDTVREATEEAKVRQATFLVTRFLERMGIGHFEETSVEQALQRVSVTFHDRGFWEWVVRQQSHGEADSIEGITTSEPRGMRSVGINRANYTFPAVVHELFHVLEHGSTRGLENGLVEGITEYWTTRATGVDFRCARNSDSRVYQGELKFVRDAMAAGYVTVEQLAAAYFHGDISAVATINDFFTQYMRQREASSFAYTGGR